MKKLTKEWVKKAEDDFRAAGKLSGGRSSFHDQVCFHCQQCAEKYLKALMEEVGIPILRTHNLIILVPLLTPHYSSVATLRRGLDFLTRFAVVTRYPGESASKRQAASSLRWADKVRTLARSLLGIQPTDTRRRKSP